VRSIARALRPYQLDRFGLTKTLEDTAELLAKSSCLAIEVEVQDIDGIFSRDAEINIYRIVQEWLNNVTKHSQASVARLQVRREAEKVRMTLEDNGVGFDYDEAMNRSGVEGAFGLANLRERVRLLNGELKIESSPGRGAALIIGIPCQK
jgi:signal transduction histidine kinase